MVGHLLHGERARDAVRIGESSDTNEYFLPTPRGEQADELVGFMPGPGAAGNGLRRERLYEAM
jgi:hypothetical protein